MERDKNGLRILDHAQCLALLASVRVARVAFATNDVPMVLPVNFVVHGAELVFRSTRGSKLDAALVGKRVAVEADRFDEEHGTGWSVVVRAHARELTAPAELELARQLPLRAWGSAEADRYIAVPLDDLSGRALGDTAVP